MNDSNASAATTPRSDLFGHPRQLARLFATEMWERFGYYGMRALLMLYLTKHFILGDRAAAGIYGGYTALVYLTPLVGGLVADQYLGSKRTVKFGALMMAAGYFALAFGGQPAKPWLAFDGAQHLLVAQTHDGPTSTDKTRQLVLNGQVLDLHGRADGGLDLVAADAHVARSLPKGSYTEGATRDEARVALMLVALSIVAVGNGFFKPNISTMVGALYAPGDARRDGGFSIFYMGINLGATLGQLACPLAADYLGWPAGLGLAGAVMLLAWAFIAWDGRSLAGYGETPERAGGDKALVIYGLALAAVPLIYLLFANLMQASAPAAGAGFVGALVALPLLNKLLYGIFFLSVPGILLWSWKVGSRAELQMMVAAMVLITFNVLFWTLFEQAGSSLTLFADRNTDLTVFGHITMSAPQTQQFNTLAIVLLAPVMGALWGALAKRGREPSTTVKFAVALMGVGAGFLVLVLGAQFADSHYRVGLVWLAGLYVVQSVAELCISPVGLSMITKLSIVRVTGLMMGVWFLSISVAQSLAGLIAQAASVETVGGEITNPAQSLATYIGIYREFGLITIGVGLGLLLLSPLLRRLMNGVN